MRGAFCVGEGLWSRCESWLDPGVVREEDSLDEDDGVVVVVVVLIDGGCGDGEIDDFLVGLG